MRGKMRRPSGACEMPNAHDLVRGQVRDVSAVIQDAAVARPVHAADRHHQGGFAGAVRADERGDLALVTSRSTPRSA